ncbi:hypothetical protein IWQ60_011653, partial [Tieghemiomyces parasiticus]
MRKVITSRTILAMLLVALIQTVVIAALEAMIAYFFFSTVKDPFDGQDTDKGIPIYLILFVVAQLFLLGMVWDTVRHRNSIQLIGVVVFDLCILSYSIFQYFQITNLESGDTDATVQDGDYATRFATMKENMRPFLVAIPCIVGGAFLIYLYLGVRLHRDFGWDIFKQIGANASIRRMYRAYHVFVLLIKLDVFFFLGYSIQFIILVLRTTVVELWLTVAAVPITLVILLLAVYAVRFESRPTMMLFMFGLLLTMVYFIYRLVRIYDSSQVQRYANTSKFLTFFAAVSLLVSVCTFLQAIICYRNFGRGLKDHLQGKEDEK